MSDNVSLQESLSEELTLLPGRISRCFFLVATLDAQAIQLNHDLQASRKEALNFLHKEHADEAQGTKHFDAIQQLHSAQRELLADKLYIQKKASEWFKRAQHAVARYNSEVQRLQQSLEVSPQQSRLKHLFLNSAYDVGHSYNSHVIYHRRLHKQGATGRHSTAHEDMDHSYVSDNNTSSLYSNVPLKKRRATTANSYYDRSILNYRNTSRRNQDSMSTTSNLTSYLDKSKYSKLGLRPIELAVTAQHLSSTSNNFHSNTTEPREGVTIKLGSQKGRPRKSSSKHYALTEDFTTSPPPPPLVSINNETNSNNLTEDYICPLCNKSENENPSMVACDNCDRWYHCVCVGFVDEADAASKAFYCPNCSTALESDVDL